MVLGIVRYSAVYIYFNNNITVINLLVLHQLFETHKYHR